MGQVKKGLMDVLHATMTEAEQDEYFDTLYAEYVAKEEAYKFEDNFEPFETVPVPKHLQAKPRQVQ